MYWLMITLYIGFLIFISWLLFHSIDSQPNLSASMITISQFRASFSELEDASVIMQPYSLLIIVTAFSLNSKCHQLCSCRIYWVCDKLIEFAEFWQSVPVEVIWVDSWLMIASIDPPTISYAQLRSYFRLLALLLIIIHFEQFSINF